MVQPQNIVNCLFKAGIFRMSLCLQLISAGGGVFPGLFLAGLAGGFTHCVAMCGPFVMVQTPVQQEAGRSRLQRLRSAALLPYHLGRITTYTLLAVVFGAFLQSFLEASALRGMVSALILFSAAVMFMANAVPAIGQIFPYLTKLRLPVPVRWLSAMTRPLAASDRASSRYLLGLMLGFMPCGLVMAAMMAAISLPLPLQTAAAMMAFGIGTMPALILTSLGGQGVQLRFPKAMPVLRLLMIFISTGVLLATSGTMIYPG